MNIKLVIFWVFSIIVFLIFGIFGYMNQDLLSKNDQNKDDFTPLENKEVIVHNCKSELAKGEINYKYIIKNNKIDKETITFTAKNVTINDYMSATNINNFSATGITTSLGNGSLDFVLTFIMDYTIPSYDFTSIANDASNLGINLNKIDNYDDAILNLGNNFICE